jgi:hypothetical protein
MCYDSPPETPSLILHSFRKGTRLRDAAEELHMIKWLILLLHTICHQDLAPAMARQLGARLASPVCIQPLFLFLKCILKAMFIVVYQGLLNSPRSLLKRRGTREEEQAHLCILISDYN